MKSAQLSTYDGPDSIIINNETQMPKASAEQVLIEVKAAAVNPFDLIVSHGYARQMADLELPATLGGDLAGIIKSIGDKVEGFEIGQTVYGQAGALSGHGSFAEFAPVKASQIAPMPENLSFDQAASLPLAGVSAYQAIVETMHLKSGQRILIHGGAGGIGSVALQIAKHIGAHITTTARQADADFVKKLGADEVIDFTEQDFSKLPDKYDAVFDTVGGATNRKSYDVLAKGGIFVSMKDQPDEALATKLGIRYVYQFTVVNTDRLNKLSELITDGAIRPQIDSTFTLDQAKEAMIKLESGHPKGKLIIKIK